MKTGEKIKKLRTEKSMTQAELAGNFITRNMLSLIESGAAQPSLQTILYLAERLSVPAGILVSDDDNEYFYRRIGAMEKIRKAYTGRDFEICLGLCDSLGGEDEDDEIELIRAECCLAIAKDDFADGRLREACEKFEAACFHAGKTMHNTARIEAEAAVYCDYMKNISQSFYSDCCESTVTRELSCCDAFCKYSLILSDPTPGKAAFEEAFILSNAPGNVYAEHIKARLGMAGGDYASAREILLSVLDGTEKVPEPVMCDIFKDLEVCCREVGDFKGAYEYSNAKVVLTERFLSENPL